MTWDRKNEPPRMRGRKLQARRMRVADRDGYLCQICGKLAVNDGVADHIVPLSEGGSEGDDNMQWLCEDCHSIKTQEEARRGRERGGRDGKVVVVYGPPGAGKTRWAMEWMKAGDIIVDLDLIYSALSGQPVHHKPDNLLGFVLDTREAIYRLLDVRRKVAATVWIVISGARKDERQALIDRYEAETVLVKASVADCYENIKRDTTRPEMVRATTEIVDKWFREYEP
jgi:shikimate kinase